ncbi:hypothetical protein BC829DRAFT_384057 [Chytridium lagenaria]|nr:hypothetical protein BC829DRAFT_384057 [Chytridium lagenaria]
MCMWRLHLIIAAVVALITPGVLTYPPELQHRHLQQQPLLDDVSGASRWVDNISECPRLKRRPKAPTSVHDLRIDEINVVASLGDSITAAFGAKGLTRPGEIVEKQNTDENRGLSFLMGGDAGYSTVANYVRYFNPYAYGASFGDHLAEFCYGILCLPYSHWQSDNLNGAQSGSLVSNIGRQLDYVIHRMNTAPEIDFENDFKILNIFIGSNDVCAGCSTIANRTFLSPDVYEAEMRYLLEDIRRRVPRVIVNILMQFNVSQVWDITNKDPWCNLVRSSARVHFLPGEAGAIMRNRMDLLVQEYNKRLELIRIDYSPRNSIFPPRTPDPSFAVLVDPLFSGVQIRGWNLSYLSDIDCFHPSTQSHEIMAGGVWNNLFLPYEKKSRDLLPHTQLVCPDQFSRIPTS